MTRLTHMVLLALLGAGAAQAKVPKVVTDFAPVYSLTAQVMGDLGSPDVLVRGGSDPHDYQMRPSQAQAVETADLVIWVGPELTPWLGRVLDTVASGQRLGLLADPHTKRRIYDGINGESGTTDPHAWLDPEIAQAWAGAIRDSLSSADPENSAQYAANAAQLIADLGQLEVEATASLSKVKKPIIVGHGAFGYFAARFGLMIAAAIEEGEAVAPGAAHLSMVRSKLESGEVACLFPAADHDPGQAATLVDGTPAKLGPALDPEAVTLTPGAELYQRLIRDLAQGIASCAGG